MKQHKMDLVKEFVDGSQEWNCPFCGRDFIFQLQPTYEHIIIEMGDTSVSHYGGINGVELSDPVIEKPLNLFQKFLKNIL